MIVAGRTDGWPKGAAPSDTLRHWFGHDPARWGDFQKRCFAKLAEKPDALHPIVEAAHHGTVALLYRSRDTDHNNAVALTRYLEERTDSPVK